MKQTLLFAGLLDVAMCTAAAASQLHRGNDNSAELIHVDDRHHFLGGGLTTWHLDLEEDKERRESGVATQFDIHTAETKQNYK